MLHVASTGSRQGISRGFRRRRLAYGVKCRVRSALGIPCSYFAVHTRASPRLDGGKVECAHFLLSSSFLVSDSKQHKCEASKKRWRSFDHVSRFPPNNQCTVILPGTCMYDTYRESHRRLGQPKYISTRHQRSTNVTSWRIAEPDTSRCSSWRSERGRERDKERATHEFNKARTAQSNSLRFSVHGLRETSASLLFKIEMIF